MSLSSLRSLNEFVVSFGLNESLDFNLVSDQNSDDAEDSLNLVVTEDFSKVAYTKDDPVIAINDGDLVVNEYLLTGILPLT